MLIPWKIYFLHYEVVCFICMWCFILIIELWSILFAFFVDKKKNLERILLDPWEKSRYGRDLRYFTSGLKRIVHTAFYDILIVN